MLSSELLWNLILLFIYYYLFTPKGSSNEKHLSGTTKMLLSYFQVTNKFYKHK